MWKRWGIMVGCSMALWVTLDVYAAEKNVDLVREAEHFQRYNKVAIVIGIERYDDPTGLSPLEYAEEDANDMYDTLKAQGYMVLPPLINEKATRRNILAAVRQATKAIDPDTGTLVFFFSGHGFGDPEQQQNYLASADMLAEDNTTAVAVEEVVKIIKQAGVKRAALFIDACRNGVGKGKKGSLPGFLTKDSEGVKALFGARFGSYSFEQPSLEHGAFSYFLLEALKGGAADENGIISFDTLAHYVQRTTPQWAIDHQKDQQVQMPYTRDWSDSFGVMILGIGQPKLISPPPDSPRPVTPKVLEPEMVSIPAGSFTRGCLPDRDVVEGMKECNSDELPAREVTVKAFELAKTEVTVVQYQACVDDGGCTAPEWLEKGSQYHIQTGTDDHYKKLGDALTNANYPIVGVSWNNAHAYVQWLSNKTGKPYRLPSEAEWEYASRAGSNNTAYSWGNSIGKNKANCDNDVCGDSHEYTAPVASFTANGYGLHDLHGNVWEWTADCYASDYTNASSDGTVVDSTDCSLRVLRGGSWDFISLILRSASRYNSVPTNRYNYVGFRVAAG